MSYPARFMEEHSVVLLDESVREVRVGIATDPDQSLVRLLQSYHLRRVRFVRLEVEELTIAMQRAAGLAADEQGGQHAPERGELSTSYAWRDAPPVSVVNGLINDAARSGASDVHIALRDGTAAVRYRVDGFLRPVEGLIPGDRVAAVAARLKVVAGLNPAERRRPQDGRFTVRLGDERFDVRFSAVPTIDGESLVLRLFPRSDERLGLDELGMPDEILRRTRAAISRVAGLMLISGPTGSGKTTTLHAALDAINDGTRKIITIEDPVEYRLAGVEQIQTNDAAGLTFDSLLRRVLRQDPNVLMVGEIRDAATAELALHAALTGHLVLTTVHGRSAHDVPDRLGQLGVDAALLHQLRPTIIAQRLVRTPAPCCGGPPGCPRCGWTGYRGRTGIFELVDGSGVRRTLREDGEEKVRRGLTLAREVAWVTT